MEIRSERCNHCDNPPCVYCCPTGASHVEDFGKTVQITANRCIGCKACVAACPYGARFINPKGYADKCTFCMHRVKEGDPAFRSARRTAYRRTSTIEEPGERARARAHTLLPEAGTKPRIFYLT
jgi:Fe-S-cluster-containing dehydrogenase component